MCAAVQPGGADARVVVYGHDRAVAALVGALASGRAPHAFLLLGPPAVGRSAVARFVAQWVLCCSQGGRRPCGTCRACRLVAADAHPDVCLLEAPIKVDAVRELQHRLSLAPMEGGQHVAILPDIDRASPGAANSLLKTLEEPPTGALLLLTASDLAGVLPTVGSRCQSLALRPMPVEQAAAALVERLGVDAEKADALARLSGGRLGWALRAALEPGVLQARDEWLGRLESAITARRSARLVLAEGLGRDREALPDGLQLWLGWLRDVLLLQHGLDAAIVNVDRQVPLRRAAERWSVRATVAALRALETASARLRGGASVELAADVFLLELPA